MATVLRNEEMLARMTLLSRIASLEDQVNHLHKLNYRNGDLERELRDLKKQLHPRLWGKTVGGKNMAVDLKTQVVDIVKEQLATIAKAEIEKLRAEWLAQGPDLNKDGKVTSTEQAIFNQVLKLYDNALQNANKLGLYIMLMNILFVVAMVFLSKFL